MCRHRGVRHELELFSGRAGRLISSARTLFLIRVDFPGLRRRVYLGNRERTFTQANSPVLPVIPTCVLQKNLSPPLVLLPRCSCSWQVVADLEQEVARVKTAHARLVRAAEAKLRDFGIPTEELGFLPQLVAGGAGGAEGGGKGAAGAGLLASRRGGGGASQRPSHHVSVTQATIKA